MGSNPGGASKNTRYCVDLDPISTRYGVDFLLFTQNLHLLRSKTTLGYYKIDFIHFISHKLVAVMHVGFADKPFRAVAHPKFNDFLFYAFCTDKGKSVTKLVRNNSFGQRFF